MTKEDEAALFARVEAMLKRIDMLDISKDLRSLLALAQAKGGGQPETWAAEREVGRWVYRRIETLAEAKPEIEPGTREGDELNYLADVVIDVEEYGENIRLKPLHPPRRLPPPGRQTRR